MAATRIFKFLLKLAIAAAIVVGAVFGVKALLDSKTKNTVIANTSISTNVSSKALALVDSFDSSKMLDSDADKTRISSLKYINKALVNYYNYYVSLSMFEKQNDDAARNKIVSKIKEWGNKIDDVTYSFQFIDSITTQDIANNPSLKEIKNQRIKHSTELFIQATQILFDLDEMLQSYVYKNNYCAEVTGIVYEAQLEMIKDYSKTAFNVDIANKIGSGDNPTIITNVDTDMTETNFSSVMRKFINRQSYNGNGREEVHFSQFYMVIDKTKLNEFYKLNNGEKYSYINGLNETYTKYFRSLYDYLNKSSF